MAKIASFFGSVALAVSCSSYASAQEAQTAPQETAAVIEPLQLEFSETGLGGPAGAELRSKIGNSQFIMIGEDHGFADAPALVAAFVAEARPDHDYVYAAEVGPITARWVQGELRDGGLNGLEAALAGKPLAIPFLSMREEAEVASQFLNEGQLWGIDQEFIGSPLIHLESLKERRDDASGSVASLLENEIASFAAGDQSSAFMATADKERFARLCSIYVNDTEAVKIIDALEVSQEIYQANFEGRGLDNNLDRVALIRQYFLREYRQAAALKSDAPRVIFKMGAVHAGRATSPMSTFDVGSLIEGMAASNGLDALHIAYIPIGGEQAYVKPSETSAFAVRDVGGQGEGIKAALEAAGVDMSQVMNSEGHFLIDLEAVRRQMGNRGLNSTNPMFRFLVLGFDYLVTTSDGKPATPLSSG